jgi:hypothetical protein
MISTTNKTKNKKENKAVFLENFTVSQLDNKFSAFVQINESFMYFQEPATLSI